MTWLYTHRKMIILLFMAALGLLVLALYLGGMSIDDVIRYTSGSGLLLAALVIIALFCLKPFVVFASSTVLNLATGILFRPAAAIVILYIGSLFQGTIGYFLGRSLGHDRISRLMARSGRAQRYLTYNQDNSAVTCFWSRAIPLPYDLTSMFCGASGTPFFSFILFSLLGRTPWIFSWAFAGSAIANPLSWEFILPFGICMALTGLLFLLSRRFQRRRSSTAKSDTKVP